LTEIVLEAVKQNGNSLVDVLLLYGEDREIVLEAVKQNGLSLKLIKDDHIGKIFKSDREIVLEAVKSNGRALK